MKKYIADTFIHKSNGAEHLQRVEFTRPFFGSREFDWILEDLSFLATDPWLVSDRESHFLTLHISADGVEKFVVRATFEDDKLVLSIARPREKYAILRKAA